MGKKMGPTAVLMAKMCSGYNLFADWKRSEVDVMHLDAIANARV